MIAKHFPLESVPQIIHFADKYCDQDWHLNTEHLKFYSITFIFEGSISYNIDGTDFIAKKGDIIFIKPGSTRRATTTGFYCVAIDFTVKESYIEYTNHTKYGNFNDFKLYFDEIKRESLQKKDGYQLKCSGLLMIILHKIFFDIRQEEKNTYVEKIKDYIIENYHQPLSLKKLSKQVGISPVYCGALFKKYEQKSVGQFINQVRIHASLELLFLENPLPIAQIAEQVGFSDVYYFSNTFKKIVGVSPLNYRKKNLG